MLQMCDDCFEIKNEFKNIQKQMTSELDEVLSENNMMKNDNNASDENTYISNDENVDVIDEMIDDEMVIENMNNEPELSQVQVLNHGKKKKEDSELELSRVQN